MKKETKIEKNTQKEVKYSKIKIVPFIRDLKKELKKYKNVEKLEVVDEIKEGLPKMKQDEKYFLCQNQNGKPVVKTGFMLEYGYKKLPSGSFVPVDKPVVSALKVSKNIEFSDSFGAKTKLKAGDYVVIKDKNIIGIKKSAFEENYTLMVKEKKSKTNEELAK